MDDLRPRYLGHSGTPFLNSSPIRIARTSLVVGLNSCSKARESSKSSGLFFTNRISGIERPFFLEYLIPSRIAPRTAMRWIFLFAAILVIGGSKKRSALWISSWDNNIIFHLSLPSLTKVDGNILLFQFSDGPSLCEGIRWEKRSSFVKRVSQYLFLLAAIRGFLPQEERRKLQTIIGHHYATNLLHRCEGLSGRIV